MRIIHIHIDENTISVNNDDRTVYRFPDYYLDRLEKVDTFSESELEDFGIEIYKQIFSTSRRKNDLTRCLERLEDGESLVLKISSDDEKVHNIPFELIYHPDLGFLLKRGDVSIVRDIPALYKKYVSQKFPLRILIIVSLPLETYKSNPIDPLDELKVIYDALSDYLNRGLVEIDVEEKSNLTAIRNRLAQNDYDIVHFTGHGARGGKLLIEDDEEPERETLISARDFLKEFKYRSVNLFYFDACETAKADQLEPSLAYHIYKNLPHAFVIANLMSVYDHLATRAAKHIYRAMFEQPAGLVLNEMRVNLVKDWWKPVIFASEPEARLFKKAEVQRVEEKRIKFLPPETRQITYVYRYGLVRKASDHIEKGNHLLLHGIGGAGKSTLARYLAEFFAGRFKHVFFFNLKEFKESLELLRRAIRELRKAGLVTNEEYKEFNQSLDELEPEDVVFDQLDFLRSHLEGKILFVLDDFEHAQDEKGIIKSEWKYFVSELLNIENIFIIFTSRLKIYLNDRDALDNILEIGEYTEAEVGFLYKRLNKDAQKYFIDHKKEIEKYFGSHPLSLARVVELQPQDMSSLLKTEEFKVIFEFYRFYFQKFAQDVSLLFTLEFPFSQKFMEIMFSPDFVFDCKSRLMVFKKVNQDTFILYPVLKSYFKDDFVLERNIKKEKFLSIADNQLLPWDYLNVFLNLLQIYKETKDQNLETQLIKVFDKINWEDHLRSFALVCDFKDCFENFTNFEDTEKARIYNDLARVYEEKGEYNKAIELYDKAMKIWEEVLGGEHPDTATTYNNLAGVYRAKGEYDKAIEFYEKAMRIREEVLGKKHSDTATIYNNLARVYKDKGEYDKAIEFYKKAMRIWEEVLGSEHPFTATSYNNLAVVYEDKGKYDKAIEFYEKAMRIREEVRGKKHPDTAATYNNLAGVYYKKGEHDKAIEFYEKAMRIWEEVLGRKHPFTSTSYNNLAVVYGDKGEYDKAIEFNEKAMRIREEVLGRKHPDTAATYSNLAGVYYKKGEYDKAIEFYEKAMRIWEEVLGEKHPDTATTYNNLARVYKDKGEYDKAIEFNEKAMRIREEVLGRKHPDTAATYNNLAEVYEDKGEYDKAIEFYEKAMRIREKVLGREHPATATTYNNLAWVYYRKGEYARAMEFWQKGFEIYKKRKDYKQQFEILPFLINALIKTQDVNYQTLADYFCDYLEFIDIFKEDMIKHIEFFVTEGTFQDIDLEQLKKHIPYPVYQERAEQFISQIN